MLRLPQTAFETAVHEAGHAVQAHVNGLGIKCLSLSPPLVRTVEQHQLEAAGYRLLAPGKREDHLVEFYRRDIEVRVAGPLASLRLQQDQTGQSLESVAPEDAELWLWGGASSDTSIGDEEAALAEATILSRWHPLRPEPYLNWVKGEVWRDTMLDGYRWGAILRLAEELHRSSTMTGIAAETIVAGALALPLPS